MIDQRRAAFSLIELIVVMSVTGVLLLLSIAWINETMKFSSRVRGHQAQHLQLTRFARQFRADVQASQSAVIQDENRLILQSAQPGQTIYEIKGTKISLEKDAGTQVRRESFTFNPDSHVQWETEGLPDSIGLIVIRVNRHDGPADAADNSPSTNSNIELATLPVDIHVVAQINRWSVKYGIASDDRGGE